MKAKVRDSKEVYDTYRVEFMLLLVELRAQDLVWRPFHESWRDLLKTEKLCGVTTFEAFEYGVRVMSLKEAEQYGVTALSTIARAPATIRKRLIKNLQAWYGQHATPPTHRSVSRWVWRRRRELTPTEVSRGKLLRYVEQLKQQLKDAGVRPKSLSRMK